MDLCRDKQCDRNAHAKGLCKRHYRTAMRAAFPRDSFDPSELPRTFWANVDKDGPESTDGRCWIWTAAHDHGGYGRLTHRYWTVLAHVVSWEYVHGKKPAGTELDHFVCDRRNCVNPAHMRPVTPRENSLRAFSSVGSINAAKTHCPQGHPYDDTYLERVNARGGLGRRCKICRRAQRNHRRKAAA